MSSKQECVGIKAGSQTVYPEPCKELKRGKSGLASGLGVGCVAWQSTMAIPQMAWLVTNSMKHHVFLLCSRTIQVHIQTHTHGYCIHCTYAQKYVMCMRWLSVASKSQCFFCSPSEAAVPLLPCTLSPMPGGTAILRQSCGLPAHTCLTSF